MILSSETCCNNMGKTGHFSDCICLEIDNFIEGNDICNDWIVMICECDIDDQLDGLFVICQKSMKNTWSYF